MFSRLKAEGHAHYAPSSKTALTVGNISIQQLLLVLVGVDYMNPENLFYSILTNYNNTKTVT